MSPIRCRFRTMPVALGWLVSASTLLTACSEIFSYSSTAAGDGRSDAALTDGAGLEGPRPFDGPQQDRATPPEDGAPPADGVLPADGAADTAPLDSSGDGPPRSAPCSALAATTVPWKPDVVLCQAFATTNQCAAAQYCGSGWHVCTASEYLARGGRLEGSPDGKSYWLAACVKQDDAPTAPRDAVCGGGCTALVGGAPVRLSWGCAGQTTADPSFSGAFVGVHATAECRRIGEDLASTEAHWTVKNELAQINGAVCCL